MALGEPTQGQIPAQRASRYNGWWGLLDANGRWAVTPETLRSEEAPLRDGNVIAVRRDERWQFVDPQGRALSKQRYGDRVALLAPGAWLVSGNTTLRRYCWTPTSGRCAASGRTMPGRKSARAGRCW